MRNIGFKITIEYDCPNMIDEETLKDVFEGSPELAYKDMSDNYTESISNFSKCEKVIKVEITDY